MTFKYYPPSQTVNVTPTSGWNATPSTPWITISCPSGCGGAFQIQVNVAGLSATTWQGSVSVTGSGGSVVLPVTLVITTLGSGNDPSAVAALGLNSAKTAYYRFTETSGTSIADSSGGSHTGTKSGNGNAESSHATDGRREFHQPCLLMGM